MPEWRRRLGGAGGTEDSSFLGFDANGLPSDWLTAERVRSAAVARRSIPPMRRTFEAQAAYLERLGLFMRGERQRL